MKEYADNCIFFLLVTRSKKRGEARRKKGKAAVFLSLPRKAILQKERNLLASGFGKESIFKIFTKKG